jgi:hypothetical protein
MTFCRERRQLESEIYHFYETRIPQKPQNTPQGDDRATPTLSLQYELSASQRRAYNGRELEPIMMLVRV